MFSASLISLLDTNAKIGDVMFGAMAAIQQQGGHKLRTKTNVVTDDKQERGSNPRALLASLSVSPTPEPHLPRHLPVYRHCGSQLPEPLWLGFLLLDTQHILTGGSTYSGPSSCVSESSTHKVRAIVYSSASRIRPWTSGDACCVQSQMNRRTS